MAVLTPGAALPDFLEIPHLPALCLSPRTPPAGIPSLLNLAPSSDVALAPHPHLQTSYLFCPLCIFSLCTLTTAHPFLPTLLLTVSLYLLLSLSLPYSLRIFQWNAGGLQARSTKLLHFISSHPVDFIYIQESNLNLSSSFQIPGFSALRSHGTHSRSGIFSTDVADASRGVIIFVKQGLSFSELSTSSLSWLGPYSDYIEVNISLNNFFSLSFLNVYASPIRSSTKNGRTNFFLSPFFPSYVEAEAVDFSRFCFRFRFHRKRTALPPLPLPASTSASTSLV